MNFFVDGPKGKIIKEDRDDLNVSLVKDWFDKLEGNNINTLSLGFGLED